MNSSKKIFIGVAWPYVNDVFHLGNLAGAYLPPDIFARFHRLCGNEVLMVSGSDAHGTPITVRAQKEHVAPEEIAARYHELNKIYLAQFRIDYDLYTTTATQNHREVTQKMFLALLKNGFIKILTTKQPYSSKSNTFLQDRYIQGECPHCHFKEARGDQCENCGRTLEPIELINPRSKIDDSPLVLKETQNYFLDLSLLQDDIAQWLAAKGDWRDWVKSEAMGWVKEGLHPRAITRDLDYGVPLPIADIPKDKRIQNIEHKVFYVWFEAVIGYLSAAIEYSKTKHTPDYWKEFFYDKPNENKPNENKPNENKPNENKKAETYYFVGQDNLVFHTINWPAQLRGYDKVINLPTNVFVNKFLLLEGQKMSKSRGWFIETPYLLENYSADAIRFYVAFHMPESKELNFTWHDFYATTNNVLIATVGNFIHRTLTFYKTNFGETISFDGERDTQIIKEINETFERAKKNLEQGQFKEALEQIVELAAFGNKYIDTHKIWKEEKAQAKEHTLNALLIVVNLTNLLYPFIPSSMEKLCDILGKDKPSQWQPILNGTLKISKTIEPLFKKLDLKNIEKERGKLKNSQ